MRKLLYFTLLVGVVTSFYGCGREPSDPLYHVFPKSKVSFDEEVKIREILNETKIDILWIVDNSYSMEDNQNKLIANTNIFIDEFVKSSTLNWKMGLISTDDYDEPYLGFRMGDELLRGDQSAVSRFQAAVGSLGLNGATQEKTYGPVMRALDQYPGFLRDQATLVMIIVTDEQEQSWETTEDFLDHIRPKVTGEQIVAYGIFGATDLGCDNGYNFVYSEDPYSELIQATGGSVYSLCSNDFGRDLAGIAKQIVELAERPMLMLKSRPIPDSIRVFYQGKALPGGPESEGNYWFYDYDRNAIVFYSLDFAPGDDEQVKVVFSEAPEIQ